VLSVSDQFATQSISQVVQGRSGATPFYYFAKIQWLISLLPIALLLLGFKRKAG
jgi:hypothetical protein